MKSIYEEDIFGCYENYLQNQVFKHQHNQDQMRIYNEIVIINPFSQNANKHRQLPHEAEMRPV